MTSVPFFAPLWGYGGGPVFRGSKTPELSMERVDKSRTSTYLSLRKDRRSAYSSGGPIYNRPKAERPTLANGLVLGFLI